MGKISEGGRGQTWGLGLALPLAFIIYAIRVILRGKTEIVGKSGVPLKFHGEDAMCVAAFVIGFVGACHFFYFQNVSNYSPRVSLVGKITSFMVMGCAFAYFVLHR